MTKFSLTVHILFYYSSIIIHSVLVVVFDLMYIMFLQEKVYMIKHRINSEQFLSDSSVPVHLLVTAEFFVVLWLKIWNFEDRLLSAECNVVTSEHEIMLLACRNEFSGSLLRCNYCYICVLTVRNFSTQLRPYHVWRRRLNGHWGGLRIRGRHMQSGLWRLLLSRAYSFLGLLLPSSGSRSEVSCRDWLSVMS